MEEFIKLNYFSLSQPSRIPQNSFFKSMPENDFELYDFFLKLDNPDFSPMTGLSQQTQFQFFSIPYLALHFDQTTPKQHLLDRFFESRDESQVCYEMMYQQLNEASSQVSDQQLLKLSLAAFSGSPVDFPGHILKFYAALVVAKFSLEDFYAPLKKFFGEFLAYLSSYEIQFEIDFPVLFLTNFIAFPINLIQVLIAQIAASAGDFEHAIMIYQQIPNQQLNLIQTSFFAPNFHELAKEILRKLETDVDFQTGKQQSLVFTLQGELNQGPQEVFEKAIKLDPENARALRDLGSHLLTKFSQEDVKNDKKIVLEAKKCLLKAYELDPSNVTNCQNLGQLLLLTREETDICVKIYQFLDQKHPENAQVLQNLAMAYYVKNEKKRSLEIYFDALKAETTVSMEMSYQVLILANELENELETAKIHYIMSNLINKFNIYLARNQWKDDQEKVIYAMNFMWHISKPVCKLFNKLIDEAGNDRQKAGIRQILDVYLEFVKKFAGTEAGDECVGYFVQVKNRLE